jgi:hypothetical protein
MTRRVKLPRRGSGVTVSRPFPSPLHATTFDREATIERSRSSALYNCFMHDQPIRRRSHHDLPAIGEPDVHRNEHLGADDDLLSIIDGWVMLWMIGKL